jgi:hypothetical protein
MAAEDSKLQLLRDAVIFIPGLDQAPQQVDALAPALAQRIATALDRNARTARAQFSIRPGQLDGSDSSSESKSFSVYTIFRKDGDRSTPVIDLFVLDYHEHLVRNYMTMNILGRSLWILWGIISNIGNFVRALVSGKAKEGKEKGEIFFAIVVLLLLSTYILILLFALIQVALPGIGQALGKLPGSPILNSIIQAIDFVLAWFAGFAQTLIVIIAALEAIAPSLMRRLKDGIPETSVNYMSTIDYISRGERKDAIQGQISWLLEQIAEKNDTQQKQVLYRNIHLMAASFGSIIALDALFPAGEQATERFKLIDTLITIGCPIDLIRLLWPAYFAGRKALPHVPTHWINVYSPIDLISSNIRDDGTAGPPDPKILDKAFGLDSKRVENLQFLTGSEHARSGWTDIVTLAGLRAHTRYWALNETEQARNVFDLVMPHLYQDDAILS